VTPLTINLAKYQDSKSGGFFAANKFRSVLKLLGDEFNDYLYENDPNFDFNESNVNTPMNHKKSEKKENINDYYKKNNIRASESLAEDTSVDVSDNDSIYGAEERKSNFMPTQRKHPKRRVISGIEFTRSINTEIGPDKMSKRAPRTLKEVCDENNYALSTHDFENDKILIGKGTFGEVYLVQCKLNQRKYALKVLNKERVQSAGCERHLMREKELSMMFEHPNICRLEAYFMDSENCYFLLELCQVGDLNTFIKDHGKLSKKLTRLYVMELVNALEHLRKNNIVHRDLKPKNILLDDTFHCKITDFGAAKEIDPIELQREMEQ